MPRYDELALWRRRLPRELRAEATLPEDLAAFLAARLQPQDEAERALLDALVRSGGGRAEAALALAARCADRFGPPSDLAMSCALSAALAGSEAAAAILAQALRDRAAAFRKRLLRTQPQGNSGLAAALRRHASWCRRAARAWADEIDTSFLRSSYWANVFRAIGSPPALRDPKSAATGQAAAGPSLIVVAAIDGVRRRPRPAAPRFRGEAGPAPREARARERAQRRRVAEAAPRRARTQRAPSPR